MIEEFRLSSDRNEMDLDAIHDFLSSSYWAEGIPKPLLERAINNSLCFGVFDRQDEQVGFARVVTDYASFAYLADVYIIKEYRKIGLSKWLISTIVEHPDLQCLRRMMLATEDAHGLYEKYDFKPLAHPKMFMERWQPDIYKQSESDMIDERE